jgi:outer membrane protein assembly factor BamB
MGGPEQPTVARRLTDGAVVWTNPSSLQHLVAAESRIYGAASDQVSALDASSGSVLWMTIAPDRVEALTLTRDRLIATSARGIVALNTADGSRVWTHELDSRPVTPASASTEIVSVGLEDKSILALETSTGAQRWRGALDETALWVTATDDRIFVGLPKLAACALLVRAGPPPRCTFQVRMPSVGPPLVEGRLLFLALGNGSLIALDRDTLDLVRSDNLEGRAAFSPGRIKNDILVPLTNSTIAVISPAGAMTRLSSPADLRVLRQATIASAAGTIVTLSTTLQENMTLSAYRPAPPALRVTPLTSSLTLGIPVTLPGAPAPPSSQPGQPSTTVSPGSPDDNTTPAPAPSGR